MQTSHPKYSEIPRGKLSKTKILWKPREVVLSQKFLTNLEKIEIRK